MIRCIRLAAASLLALCACEIPSAAATSSLLSESSPSINGRVEQGLTPPAGQLVLAPLAPTEARRRRSSGAPADRVDAANRAATREPTGRNYFNAAQVHPWTEGALYRLYAAPERVSDIALQAGERLVSVAAGDTSRWVIGDTASGAGPERRTHILVKPTAAGLRTNLVIATDRRVYHVQLESTSRSAMASMSWTYPQDELLALSRAQTAAESAASETGGIAVEALSFGYSIKGDKPAWRPLRAFDDGRQVFIEFPPSFSTGQAPPLFVLGERGGAELVNYRLRGRFYVVDRLFDRAELRLGERRQQVVRIVREGGARQRRGRGGRS